MAGRGPLQEDVTALASLASVAGGQSPVANGTAGAATAHSGTSAASGGADAFGVGAAPPATLSTRAVKRTRSNDTTGSLHATASESLALRDHWSSGLDKSAAATAMADAAADEPEESMAALQAPGPVTAPQFSADGAPRLVTERSAGSTSSGRSRMRGDSQSAQQQPPLQLRTHHASQVHHDREDDSRDTGDSRGDEDEDEDPASVAAAAQHKAFYPSSSPGGGAHGSITGASSASRQDSDSVGPSAATPAYVGGSSQATSGGPAPLMSLSSSMSDALQHVSSRDWRVEGSGLLAGATGAPADAPSDSSLAKRARPSAIRAS